MLEETLGDAELRVRMGEAALSLGRPDAAAAVASDLADWLGWNLNDPPAARDDVSENHAGASVPKGSSKEGIEMSKELADSKPQRRRTDALSRPLSAFIATSDEPNPRRRKGDVAAPCLAGLEALSLAESDTAKAQLRGYGAYMPALRRTVSMTKRRPLVGADVLAWD